MIYDIYSTYIAIYITYYYSYNTRPGEEEIAPRAVDRTPNLTLACQLFRTSYRFSGVRSARPKTMACGHKKKKIIYPFLNAFLNV